MIEENAITAYILLFPLAALIGIPLIALVVLSIARLFTRLHGIFFKIEAHDVISEQRKSERIDIDRLLVSVVDDVEKVTGTTCNISNSGICIKNLPAEKLNASDHFTVNVNTGYQVFQMNIVRRWEKIEGNAKTIGAVIENAPNEWFEFVALEKQYA